MGQMREIELKMLLAPEAAEQLFRSEALRDRAVGAPVTRQLENTYFDTPEADFRAVGIAVRLRKAERQWIQTVKKASGPMVNGLSSPIEAECSLEEPVLALDRIADHDLREQVIGLSRKGLSVVAETRFERRSHLLRAPLGGRVELSVDRGELGANGRHAPFSEVELELLEGEAADLYALAEVLFPQGPVRFSNAPKSERARLVGEGAPDSPVLRKHRQVALSGDETVEEAAVRVLSENFAHAAPNLARLVDLDDPSGPHQLRVGLRRLRSALLAFRPALGRETVGVWAEQARDLAAEAGRLRDLDVLNELIGTQANKASDEGGFVPLIKAIQQRRAAVRLDVRTTLIGPGPTAFCFGFPGFLARRSWRRADTRKLDAPIVPFASRALAKRWKALLPYGARIDTLTVDERHEMRKELKKLRYVADAFQGLFDASAVAAFQKGVKRLQKAFGALNDSAMAERMLMAPEAPGAGDVSAQRAAGRVIGHLSAEADRLWPEAIHGWELLSARRPFWA